MRTILLGVSVLLLALFLAFTPRAALAISADDLLELLVEEKVITPEKAAKLKQKVREKEKARKAQEEARRARELQRIKEEAKREAVKEAQVAAAKAVPKPKVIVGYRKGFFMQTPDGKFRTRIRLAFQPRFTYIDRDSDIHRQYLDGKNVNEDAINTSYFRMRRLRLFFDGNAFHKDLKYFLHIQLEPDRGVNVHDANVYYTGIKNEYGSIIPWVGRGKIPYSLEFWNSGFKLNFVERSIFSGENDRNWPDNVAPFSGPAPGSNNKFHTGGFTLYRSQGVMLMGDVNLWAPRNFRYWFGIWNGVNTRGLDNMNDDRFCYSGRILFAPLPNGGPTDSELFLQGDYNYHKSWPMFYILYSMYTNADRVSYQGRATNAESYGYDLAACFKWRGFSLQWEGARETYRLLNWFPNGADLAAHREAWYIAAGYFLLPKRLEVVARYAYANRLKDRNPQNQWLLPNTTNIMARNDKGVLVNNAVEGILREYTFGLNYYVNGHRHKYMTDFSLLRRDLYNANDQEDYRFRFLAQWFF
ncbi:MAG: hypothetical protein JRI59_01210 [Deltaproteobacteria bacterium]|nr:hypothetical protein [Deltaproteobacteria bacterium]